MRLELIFNKKNLHILGIFFTTFLLIKNAVGHSGKRTVFVVETYTPVFNKS